MGEGSGGLSIQRVVKVSHSDGACCETALIGCVSRGAELPAMVAARRSTSAPFAGGK